MGIVTNIGSVATVRLRFRQPGPDSAFNILHYQLKEVHFSGGGVFSGEASWATMPALAKAVFDWLTPEWKVFASNQVYAADAAAQDIHPGPKSRMYTYNPPALQSGLVMGDPMPLQDAITVLKYGPGASRHDLGRVFVTGFTEGAHENGILNADTTTDMGPYITALGQIVHHETNGVTYDWWPVLYSADPGPPVTTRITEILETQLSDRVFKTQRRRRPGKGI